MLVYMSAIDFKIQHKIEGKLGRAGTITTAHGEIQTPAFIPVGTKATIKALLPETVVSLGAQAELSNTYHLYLQPGDELVRDAGGLHKFMNWDKPIFTDSGGFQAFSLGSALVQKVSKFQIGGEENYRKSDDEKAPKKATVSEEGVIFFSHIDGSKHLLSPEKSIEIQHNLGGDIIFAFDECTSPNDSVEYLREAMGRTHRWAERSLTAHQSYNNVEVGLFGIVQGGNDFDMRKESAEYIGGLGFDGFGIGGSFTKEDLNKALFVVNEILPEDKPRHLLGIGSEPVDFFIGVENGCDTFDCVAPTREARNGTIYTLDGKISITNSKYINDLTPLSEWCDFFAGITYTRAYLSHLFRSKEILASTLATIINLRFVIKLVDDIRGSILEDRFEEFKGEFLARYYGKI